MVPPALALTSGKPVMLNLVTTRVSPSTSLSLVRTLPVAVWSSFRVTLSLTPTGRSLTGATVMVAVALSAETAPLLSTALYSKVVVPFQSLAGTKYTGPVTLSPAFRAVPPLAPAYRVPLAGTEPMVKPVTLPSTSLPDRFTWMRAAWSSLPEALTALATGASLVPVRVMVRVLSALAPCSSVTVTGTVMTSCSPPLR